MQSKYQAIFYAALLSATLVSCGGGGGDSGPAGAASVPYTGLTTPAAVTTSNAVPLADNALLTGQSGSSAAVNPLGVASTGTSTPALPNLARTFGRALPRIKPQRSSQTAPAGAIITESNSIPGDCAGSLSYSASYDDVTGQFSGSASFNNYDDCYGVVSGSTSVSGTIGVDITLVFTSMTFTDGTDTLQMGGTITATSNSASTSTLTMNMNFDTGSIQFKVENLEVTVTDMVSYEIINMSGRFYHSTYGYIEVSTPTSLSVAFDANYPSSGVLVIAGSNSSRAQITYTSPTTFTIQVDADGVGGYESMGNCTWGATCTITTPAPV